MEDSGEASYRLQTSYASRLPGLTSPPGDHSAIVTVPAAPHGLSGSAMAPATRESGLGMRSSSLERRCPQEKEGTGGVTVSATVTRGALVAEARGALWA